MWTEEIFEKRIFKKQKLIKLLEKFPFNFKQSIWKANNEYNVLYQKLSFAKYRLENWFFIFFIFSNFGYIF